VARFANPALLNAPPAFGQVLLVDHLDLLEVRLFGSAAVMMDSQHFNHAVVQPRDSSVGQ